MPIIDSPFLKALTENQGRLLLREQQRKFVWGCKYFGKMRAVTPRSG
jgi:hypothetical protein